MSFAAWQIISPQISEPVNFKRWKELIGLESRKPIDKQKLIEVAKRGFAQAEKLGIEIPERLLNRLQA